MKNEINVCVSRDVRIDILKFVGILCIVLAHVEPPITIFGLRNFDVVLMVMLTGTSYYLSSHMNYNNYLGYIWKRFQRLVVPTWLFLVLFFAMFYIFSELEGTVYPFETRKIIRSFLLVDGIGYVWIMRIYFLSSLVCPVILWVSTRVQNNIRYFSGLFVVYILYAGLIYHGRFISNPIVYDLYHKLLVDGMGWGLVVAVGVRIYKLSKRALFFGAVFLFLVFIGLAIRNGFTPIQEYKYPPTLYYISYGLFISFALLLLLENKKIQNFMNNKVIMYIARNSFGLYLYHIIPLYVISFWGTKMPLINHNWASKFLFVAFWAFVFDMLQKQILSVVRKKGLV